MVDKTCEVCKEVFQVQPYRANRARFCSRSCGGKWHITQRTMGNRFQRGNKLRKGQRPSNAFTKGQTAGKNNVNYTKRVKLKCSGCGKKFLALPSRTKRIKKLVFCSRKCFTTSDALAGAKHPSYVGGSKTYRGRGWREARKLAVERDKGACQRCQRYIGASIPVHHIRPFREFQTAESANELSNLICLCNSCHAKVEPRNLFQAVL